MNRINKQKTFNFLNRKNKWLGLIDYKTIVVLLVYIFIIYELISIVVIRAVYKLYIMIVFVLPYIIFMLLNLNEECIIDKLIVIIKFLLKRKKYVNMIFYTILFAFLGARIYYVLFNWELYSHDLFYTKNNTIYVENVEKLRIVKSKK